MYWLLLLFRHLHVICLVGLILLLQLRLVGVHTVATTASLKRLTSGLKSVAILRRLLISVSDVVIDE